MKTIIIPVLILSFLISSISIAQNVIKLQNNPNEIDSLRAKISELSNKVEKLEIEKNYFQSILQDNNQFYSIIIAVVFSLLSLISFSYFTRKSRELKKALKLFANHKTKLEELIAEQQHHKIQSDYSYANICNLIGGLEFNPPYANYNKSFFYYMRSIKYLIQSKHLAGVPDNLINAEASLERGIKSDFVTTQHWELKEHHIKEVRQTLLELQNIDYDSFKISLNNVIKLFETNLEKIKK